MSEERLIGRVTAGSILLLFLVLAFSKYVKGAGLAEQSSDAAGVTTDKETPENITDILAPTQGETMTVVTVMPPEITMPPQNFSAAWDGIAGVSANIYYNLTDRTIIFEKSDGYEDAELVLTELPVSRQIQVTISNIRGKALADHQIKRISEDTYYYGTPPTPTPTAMPTPTIAGKVPVPGVTLTPIPTLSPDDPYYPWRNDVVTQIETSEELFDDGSLTQTLLLTLDKTYVYKVYEDEWNFYISLIRPKDVYNKIVVIDAGHGGIDMGTTSARAEYMEKSINLNIVFYLKELLDDNNEIKVYYTRLNDVKPTLKQRVNLANDVEADFFLSVHCNANETKKLHGTEVLYNSLQNEWTGMNSRRFASICMEEMNSHLGLFDRGVIARDHNVTIVRDAKMPVALVETAFMSNTSDMEVLATEEAQRSIAQGLYDAILRAYKELEQQSEKETE